MKMNLLNYFNKKRELSPNNRKEYPLNEHGYVDLGNQFIDSSDLANKYEKCDFSKNEATEKALGIVLPENL